MLVRSGNDPDDEGSVVNGQLDHDPAAKATLFCGSCKTRDSAVWWKGPKGLSSSVMCEPCGIAWRKYGDVSGPPKVEPLPAKKLLNGTAGEKREGTPLVQPPLKKQKVRVERPTALRAPRLNLAFQPMPPANKHGACACCRKVGLAGTVVKCQGCNLVVHACESRGRNVKVRILIETPLAAYGVSKADAGIEAWLCEVCANEKHQEFALVRGLRVSTTTVC